MTLLWEHYQLQVFEYPHFDVIGTCELYDSLCQTIETFQKVLSGSGILRDFLSVGQAMLTGDKIQEVYSTITGIVQELHKLCSNMKEHHELLKIE